MPYRSLSDWLGRFYDAFNLRHLDQVLEQLTDDVDWPNAQDGTRLTGREAVERYWMEQFTTIDPQVEPIAFVQREADVVVAVHHTVRDRAGALLRDLDVAHVYQFEGSLIRRMDIVESFEAALGPRFKERRVRPTAVAWNPAPVDWPTPRRRLRRDSR